MFVCVDACLKFAIDMGLELVILYEHIYEIYGDIQGASNSFKIEAYEQGKATKSGVMLVKSWILIIAQIKSLSKLPEIPHRTTFPPQTWLLYSTLYSTNMASYYQQP